MGETWIFGYPSNVADIPAPVWDAADWVVLPLNEPRIWTEPLPALSELTAPIVGFHQACGTVPPPVKLPELSASVPITTPCTFRAATRRCWRRLGWGDRRARMVGRSVDSSHGLCKQAR